MLVLLVLTFGEGVSPCKQLSNGTTLMGFPLDEACDSVDVIAIHESEEAPYVGDQPTVEPLVILDAKRGTFGLQWVEARDSMRKGSVN